MTTVTGSRFEDILSDLTSKCNLSREQISELIKQKRERVGGGYLTDQGALFLVAADLGVIVEYGREKPRSLSQLTKEQISVTVTGRILSTGFPKAFRRKDDSGKGLLSRLVIYDNTATVSVSLWDRSVTDFFESETRPGDEVRISGAIVRSAIDGSIGLSLGEKSQIQRIEDERNSPQIPKLEQRIQAFQSVPESGKFMIIRGRVVGESRKTGFKRSDGTQSDLTTFTICDTENRSLKYRAVMWGNANPVFTSIKDSEIITLLNVRTRLSNFQDMVSVEIHGDETTCVLEHWDETRNWMKELAKVLDANERRAQSGVLPFVARVFAVERAMEDRAYLLLVDSQNRRISVSASGEALNDVSQLNIDDVIVVRPESFDSVGLKANLTKSKSITKSSSKRSDIPQASLLVCTVEKLGESGIASLELMCLTDSLGREIQTKDGPVRRTEITVADHTGELKIYGWRNLSKALENYSAGDRIWLSAVEVQTHEGKKFLVLKNYSSVSKQKN